MEGKNKKLLEDMGVDIPSTMERFMQNEGIYFRFLLKFRENSQFEELAQAFKREDWEQALVTSHNLKGYCGNLGLARILQLLTSQVNLLRAGDNQGAAGLLDDILMEHDKIIGLMEELEH